MKKEKLIRNGIDFAIIGEEYITLYNDDNTPMNVGDTAYCLIFNDQDYHLPIRIRGTIIADNFTTGQNKAYIVKFEEFLENPAVLKKFLHSKKISVIEVNIAGDPVGNQKPRVAGLFLTDTKQNRWATRVESFFIRNSFEKINQLKHEYLDILKRDIQIQLEDVNQMLTEFNN